MKQRTVKQIKHDLEYSLYRLKLIDHGANNREYFYWRNRRDELKNELKNI